MALRVRAPAHLPTTPRLGKRPNFCPRLTFYLFVIFRSRFLFFLWVDLLAWAAATASKLVSCNSGS